MFTNQGFVIFSNINLLFTKFSSFIKDLRMYQEKGIKLHDVPLHKHRFHFTLVCVFTLLYDRHEILFSQGISFVKLTECLRFIKEIIRKIKNKLSGK